MPVDNLAILYVIGRIRRAEKDGAPLHWSTITNGDKKPSLTEKAATIAIERGDVVKGSDGYLRAKN